MTMFLAPYTAIADIDGSPLDAGFLFFGEYGKDPELFPVEVFWDADFTVPAAQPIRTRNGYPVRNGSPAKVYLKTAQHSIVIKNRNSAFILVDFKNKGWDASFVVDDNETQKEVNDKSLQWVNGVATLRGFKKRTLTQCIAMTDGSFWNTSPSGVDDGTMTVIADDGTVWKRGRAGSLRLTSFGAIDDSASAFEKLFTFINTLPSSYSDNGQAIRKIDIDLEGFVWETSRTILGVQGIGGLNFINGQIKATDDFVGDYLVEFTDAVALRAYHYISWNHVIFDANRKTNCARFNRLLKSGVTTCHFLRWKENGYGLVVGKTPTDTLGAAAEAHEFYVNGQCSFAQYDFTQQYAGQICTGTALYINTYDGKYSDFFISGAGRGIEHIQCGLNIFENIHIYGIYEPKYGFYADCSGVNSFLILTNMYFDGCSFRALNPIHINFTNNRIFRNDSNAEGLIIFDTSIENNIAQRVVITGNHFNTAYDGGKNQIQFVNDGGGSWSTGLPQDIVSFANTNLGYVKLFDTGYGGQNSWMQWNGYTLGPRYALDQVNTFTFDVKPYHNLNRGQDTSATVSEWLITSNWQANTGNGIGAYRMTVFQMPSGGYYGLVEPVGTGLTSVYSATGPSVTTTKNKPIGFDAEPVISTTGIITVDLTDFYRGAIYRQDQRNYLPTT
ncbi:MAG: hypothetical protein ACK4GF_07765 [Acinetobacter johnsonii]